MQQEEQKAVLPKHLRDQDVELVPAKALTMMDDVLEFQ